MASRFASRFSILPLFMFPFLRADDLNLNKYKVLMAYVGNPLLSALSR